MSPRRTEPPAPRFASRIDVDLTPNALARLLAARRADGARILDLTASNPTQAGFDYPEAEIRAALAAPGVVRYEPAPRGLPEARAAVSAYYAARGEAVDPDDLLISASTSESYTWLLKLLADPGDEILVPAPSYPLFDVLAALESVALVRYPLERTQGDGWQIGREALERALSPRTRAIVVVHPNNPTGSFVSTDERAWLCALCAQRGIPLIADEVFLDYGRGETCEQSFAVAHAALGFTLSGLSKVAGLPQLKLGWIALAGPAPLRCAARDRLEFIADAYLSVGAPVQHAAAQLLALRARIQPQIAARVAENEARLRDLCARSTGCRLLARGGGWYGIVELAREIDEEALCFELLAKHGVLVHPGYFFDFARAGALVVSLLTPPDELALGARRAIECANSM